MAEQQSYFRGYWSIKEVTDKMDRLADWMQVNKPACREMTLIRKDFDLLKRWPQAAGLLKVEVAQGGGLSYRGFHLKHDNKEPRYEKSASDKAMDQPHRGH